MNYTLNENAIFSLYLNIHGLREGPGKFFLGVLEGPGKVLDFFVSKGVGTLIFTCYVFVNSRCTVMKLKGV